jgi:hypothetical protein
VDDQVILLDLIHGRYHGVAGPPVDALAEFVQGWPTASQPAMAPRVNSLQPQSAGPLIERGLVIPGHGRPIAVERLPEPAVAIEGWGESSAQGFGVGKWLQLIGGASWSAFQLRTCTLERIARTVAFRRLVHAGPDAQAVNPELLQSMVSAYRRARPIVMTSKDRCLLDSLALIQFLASERLFPHWVIGVKTRPFGAHAWVQLGALVLNDRLERVRRFTPILVA